VFATAAGPGLTGTLIDWGVDLATQFTMLGAYCVLATAAMVVASRQLTARKGGTA
jgi:hypothetical protein